MCFMSCIDNIHGPIFIMRMKHQRMGKLRTSYICGKAEFGRWCFGSWYRKWLVKTCNGFTRNKSQFIYYLHCPVKKATWLFLPEVSGKRIIKKAPIQLKDFRQSDEKSVRILSFGMSEHIERHQYETFFDSVAQALEPDAVAFIHSIGRTGPASTINLWIEKYIFPSGYIPSLTEIMMSIEKSTLMVTNVEIMRLHYAETLKLWWEAFETQCEWIISLYDGHFFQILLFYLLGFKYSFRSKTNMVLQI